MLLLVLSVAATAAPEFETFCNRFVAFDKAYQQFVQHFCGWSGPTPADTSCRPSSQLVDYGEYLKARAAAKRFFDLAEPAR